MTDGPHGARVPRAVAGVPPPALADGEAVAKAWLLELLAGASLARAAGVLVGELAARGPALCAALLGAVGSDAELERLAPGGDRAALAAGAGALAGADAPAAAAGAVAALRRALWRALAQDLRDLDAAGTAALAERVAHVADVVTAATLERPGAAPTADAPPPIAADLAGAEEPWRAMIEAQLRAGAPFAVLAVEAADAERLLAAGGADAAAVVAFERGVRGAARPGDAVVRERAGLMWVVAPGADASAARGLAEALADAAAAAAAPHGAPLAAAVGIAVSPGDGADAAVLAQFADERRFAALAAGVPVV